MFGALSNKRGTSQSDLRADPPYLNNLSVIFHWTIYEGAIAAFAVTVVLAFGGPFISDLAKHHALVLNPSCDPDLGVDAAAMMHGKSLHVLFGEHYGDHSHNQPKDSLSGGTKPCTVPVFGLPVLYSSVFSYATSLSVILQVIVLPAIGALADLGYHSLIFVISTVLACTLTGLMAFASYENHMWELASLLFIVANLACGVCVVLLNALLPEIASSANRDRVSSWGHAVGFVCGTVVIILEILIMMQFSEESDMRMRAVIVFSAGWWLVLSALPLRRFAEVMRAAGRTHEDGTDKTTDNTDNTNNTTNNTESSANVAAKNNTDTNLEAPQQQRPVVAFQRPELDHSGFPLFVGYKQFFHTVKSIKTIPHTGYYLLANMFYSDGLWTVGSVMTLFGQRELGMDTFLLGVAVLLFQIMGCVGCFVFEAVARAYTTRLAIASSLVIFIFLCVYCLVAMRTIPEFFAVTALGALATGGCSALSRSLFSQIIPTGMEAEFFSIYEITDRGTAWLGPLVFGIVNQLTNSMRLAIISLVAFFALGLLFLSWVDVRQAVLDAKGLAEVERQSALEIELRKHSQSSNHLDSVAVDPHTHDSGVAAKTKQGYSNLTDET